VLMYHGQCHFFAHRSIPAYSSTYPRIRAERPLGRGRSFVTTFVTNVVERWLAEICHACHLASRSQACLGCATRPEPCDDAGLPACLVNGKRCSLE